MHKIIVCDFDGTLISVNSFPLWIKFIIKQAALSFNIRILVRVLFLLLSRKVFGIAHADFKYKLMKLNIPELYNENFVITLIPFLNDKLIALLKSVENKVIVSTAAPSSYAKYLKNILPFSVERVLCSEIECNCLVENYGRNKVNLIHTLFGSNSITHVYTDHHEDMPLILNAEKSFLVSPNDDTLKILQAKNIKFEKL
jgi:phosphoserine phosphatase